MNLRAFILSLMVLLAPSVAVAGADAKADKASAYIEALGHKALNALADKKLDKDAKQKTLESIFRDNVDFPWVARFVSARFWRTATPEQQKRFVQAYQNFLIKHYTSRFTEYTSGSFKITSSSEIGENEYQVGMEILSGSGEPPILIDYKTRKEKAGYKVFDIIVEGVSLITTQRSEFTSVLNSKGMDGLTEMLEAKTNGKAVAAQ